jgi:hypothetical protein
MRALQNRDEKSRRKDEHVGSSGRYGDIWDQSLDFG